MSSADHEDAEGVVAVSPTTGTVYRVYRWDDAGDDGKIVSRSKRVLDRDHIRNHVDTESLHEAARRAHRNSPVDGESDSNP